MPNRNLYILALLLAVGLMIPHASESRVFPGDEWITTVSYTHLTLPTILLV